MTIRALLTVPPPRKTFIPDSYALILVLFSCALETHFLWTAKGSLAISVLILLVNFRLWYIALVQIAIALCWLAPMFPRQPNHANAEFFISLVILGLFALKFLKLKTHVTPALTSWAFRLVTLGIYFYSGFHKLNTDFFNTSVSCINEYWSAPIGQVLGLLGCDHCAPQLTQLPFPLFTVLLEMALPFGLFWHRTRKPAIYLLIAFHAFLGIHGLLNFSALAMFLLAGSTINFEQPVSGRTIQALRIYMLGIMANAFFHLGGSFKLPGFRSWEFVTFISTVAFTIATFWFFVILFKENKKPAYRLRVQNWPVLATVFACMTFWALKNYVGLGTVGNFSMFSNLVTEKNRCNHFLIDTRNTKIWDFEEDCVQIVKLESGSRWQKLNADVMERSLVPVVQFGHLIRRWSGETPGKIPCTLIYQGKTLQIDDLKNSTFAEYRWWYHYLPFRVVQIDGPNQCRW
ncbi:hypothetical protein GCM10010967_02570 [Dyadobacter beijingensis]|uniref:HTTM domain-containing protein n=1 Tax=Dyadobacter beijingensis TaxID=365489 RepID=A0ABQ2HD36_9BACT|nr:HTTM domain-containing protein [Dyadobacter beijingensis]GGM74594.1 hypothetical protein GCM10010967_02570 [Dyadobacter beijingensis]